MSVWIKRISAQQRIEACTAALRAESLSGENLTTLYVIRGKSYFETNSYTRSLKDLNRAIALNPKLPYAYAMRTSVRIATGNLRGALADSEKAIRFASRMRDEYNDTAMSELFVTRCDVQRRMKNYDRAILDCDTAIKRNSKSASAYRTRGKTWSGKDNHEQARSDLSQALGLGAKDEDTYAWRGYVNFYLANFKEAAEDFQYAVKTNPEDPYYALLLYLARTRAGDASGQTELQTNTAKLKADKWPHPIVDLYLGTKTPEAMVAAAATLRERCEAAFHLGQWHLIRGANDEAPARFRTTLKICPKDFIVFKSAFAELQRLGQ